MTNIETRTQRLRRHLSRGASLVRLQLTSTLGLGPALPPGTLGPWSVAGLGDERFYFRKLQRYGPIFKVWWSQHLTVCIVGFARAQRLLSIHRRALLPLTIDIGSFVPYGFLRSMPPAQHTLYRALFLAAFRDGLTEAWEPELRALIRSELASLAEDTSSGQPPAAPALTPTLDRIATRAVLILIFGLRSEHPLVARLEAGFRRMGPTEFVHPIGAEQRQAFEDIRALVWQAVEALRTRSTWADGDGVLGRLVAEASSSIDDTVIGNLIYMIEMGRYDVRSLFRWVLKYLSDSPAVIADLQGAGDMDEAGRQTSLAEAIVLETLRLDQAEALNRAVTEDFVFDGYRIPKGSQLRVLIRESQQDPDTFPDPGTFKPCRFARQSYPSHAYAPFGVGEHRCVAASMVVRLSTLLVEELAAGFTWSVVGDGSRYRGRYHWEPAPTFELALRRREGVT